MKLPRNMAFRGKNAFIPGGREPLGIGEEITFGGYYLYEQSIPFYGWDVEMWVSRSFDSVGSRARAALGKLRGVFASRIDDDYEDDGPLAIEAPRGLDNDEFETVKVGGSEEIYVAKPSEAAYFEIDQDYAPTIVGAAKVDARVDDIVEPRSRREKAAAGEPADLFINALRRPVHQKFDASAPVFKKKAEAEPVTAPATEVEPVVEQIVFEAEDVAEQTEVVVAPEVAPEEVETVIDETVIEAPAVETPAVEAEPVAEENLEIPVINIPVIETPAEEPVAEVPAAEPEPVIEVAPVAEPIMTLPAPAAPVEAAEPEEYDFSMFDNLESEDACVEYEISHEVGKEETFEDLAAETPAVEAEPVAEENLEIPVINIPVAEAPAEETVTEAAAEEIPAVEAGPVAEDSTVFDVASLVAVEPVVEAVAEETPAVEAEPVAEEEAEPIRALPTKVVLSLPQKIEIPELQRSAPEQDTFSGYTADEKAETNAKAEESKMFDTNTVGEIKEQLPPVILNEDRDVLFAFRGELESDEFEFINTSYDDNLAFREDYLDETERTFKIRAKIERPRFNGDLRSLAYY